MATPECIFCGGRPVTREHLLPEWMTAVFQNHPLAHGNPPEFRHHLTIESPRRERISRTWPASGMDTKVRCVCRSCNQGWMSDIEDAARPHLTAMITSGESLLLTKKMRQEIAAWAALKAMVAKTIGDHPLVSKHWREWIFEHHLAPREWHIWIASYGGRVSSFFEVFDTHDPLAPVDDPLYGVVFTTLLGYLQLKVLGVSRTTRQIDGQIALRLWPQRATSVSWPPAAHFSDSTVAWFFGLWKPRPSGIIETYPGVVLPVPSNVSVRPLSKP